MLFTLYLFIAFIGMMSHWFKKWVRDEIQCSYADYMIGEKKHTAAALISTVFGVLISYHAGMEFSQSNVSLFLLIGYGCDSAANKSPE